MYYKYGLHTKRYQKCLSKLIMQYMLSTWRHILAENCKVKLKSINHTYCSKFNKELKE